MNGSITVRLPGKDIKKIDSLILAGLYSNCSDFLKHGARHLLWEEAPEIPDLIARLQAQAKHKYISKEKVLKDVRNMRSIRSHLAMMRFFLDATIGDIPTKRMH